MEIYIKIIICSAIGSLIGCLLAYGIERIIENIRSATFFTLMAKSIEEIKKEKSKKKAKSPKKEKNHKGKLYL